VWLGLAVAASVCVAFTSVPAGATSRPGTRRPAPVTTARAPIGAVTLGRVAPSAATACIDDYLWLQGFNDPDKTGYQVPFAGVITSVSSWANSNPNAKIQAVFVTATSTLTTYAVSQRSPVFTLAPDQLNSFPVRIPVAARALLALRTVSGQPRCEGPGGSVDQDFLGSLDGTATTWTSVGSHLHVIVNISAVWEPDEDGDGYGDVSQDRCPALAAVHDPCPAPVVTVTKAPKKRITGHRVKIRFAADVPGSTYACSIDGRAFKGCGSPFKGRFLLGTHTVRIMATSPVGVAGQPVTVQFKVVTPKR